MKMNEYWGIQYEQEGQEFISVVLPVGFIIENSEVLIYGKDKIYGYQRAPRKDHYSKIATGILSFPKDNGLVSPNSIVLGINKGDIHTLFTIEDLSQGTNGRQLLKMTPAENTGKIKMRIIDGQHRIMGFKDAVIRNPSRKDEINAYLINVIIMLVDPKHRLAEVQVFSDINSKAKPIKMDLTILAKYQYYLLEQPDDMHIKQYLETRVLEKINSGEKSKYWKNAIIFGVNDDKKVGSVGFKTFLQSIEKLCNYKLAPIEGEIQGKDFNEKKRRLDELAETIYEILSNCWNVVLEKWPAQNERVIMENDEVYHVYYDEKYYLQRTMGTVAINNMITEYVVEKDVYAFIEAIKNSKLDLEDWRVKGKFSGLNSLSGTKKIVQAIIGNGDKY